MPRTGNRLNRHLGTLGLLGLAAAGAVAAVGCNSDTDGTCTSDEEFFATQVWAPILSTKCIGCHNPQGAAAKSKMVLRGSAEAGFLNTNMEIFRNVASFEQNGESLVLLKPTKTIEHGGGLVIQKDGPEYKALSEMVDRFKEPSACQPDPARFYAGVQLASPSETLRMAALELGARLPTPEEEQAVAEHGMDALDPVLDRLMTEEAFYVRLKEIYNDLFLTDFYMNGGEAGTDLLSSDDYDPRWYDHVTYDPGMIEYYGAKGWDDLYNKFASWTNRGVAREPLELIAHVVRENKPFTEILTAPYMMVNPFSAKAFGVWDATFQNDADPNEYVETYREGIPHAGVLSSPVWLARHPTTDTNRNRHRARMVFLYFLGTDILKTAEQPLDSTKITDFNPTMNNTACVVCHQQIDPIAGTFHVYAPDTLDYDGTDTWHEDMRPPGFGSDTVPYEQFPTSLQWLGQHVSADPRFDLAAVYAMLTGLTGQAPMLAPANGEENFQVKFDAYLAQYYLLNEIVQRFQDSGHNLKTVVKEIIKSPYFRARNYGGEIDADRKVGLEQLGSTRFLTPEQLHRKIWAITGYPWREGRFNGDFLMSANRYRLLYGGIDSQDVTARIKEPNGIMANIADRMANEMSCLAVPHDFVLPVEERLLFPEVEVSVEPQDANGYDIPPAIEQIKKEIVYLHKRILGETLDINDPEIQRTYQLFLETWQEGKAAMAKQDTDPGYVPTWLACDATEDYWTGTPLPDDEQLTEDDTYTVRAWMSVTTYLMSDFRFLYQ